LVIVNNLPPGAGAGRGSAGRRMGPPPGASTRGLPILTGSSTYDRIVNNSSRRLPPPASRRRRAAPGTQAKRIRMFPLNAWYVACTPDEIEGKPLGRRICGLSMCLYRDGEGRAAAVEDFCPHRGAALSLGTVCEGKLVCGYHGLVMGRDGCTVSMPGQRVGGFPRIRSYPGLERNGFAWVWPGAPALATPDALPPSGWAESLDWAYGGGLYHVKADYRLMVDNLMDLTHETYVHASSIGQKEIDESPVTTRVVGQEVVTSRFMENVLAPPFWRAALRANGLPDDQPVDRWQICHFTLPSHIMIEVGVSLAGNGGHQAADAVKASSIVVDFITPETD